MGQFCHLLTVLKITQHQIPIARFNGDPGTSSELTHSQMTCVTVSGTLGTAAELVERGRVQDTRSLVLGRTYKIETRHFPSSVSSVLG